jgi:CRP/FNR family transcriptional regulator, anaerobic regulatory protein
MKTMKNNNLIKTLNAIRPLSDTINKDIFSRIKIIHFKKGTMIHVAGDVCPNLYFVNKGIVRHYFVHNDKELTYWFSQEGEFVTDSSFLKQDKGFENIQAIEDTSMYYVTASDFEYLCIKYHEIENIGRMMMTELYVALEQHYAEVMMLSAAERYELMKKKYPGFIKRIPLHFIAGFLNITPETLSRIRKSI